MQLLMRYCLPINQLELMHLLPKHTVDSQLVTHSELAVLPTWLVNYNSRKVFHLLIRF